MKAAETIRAAIEEAVNEGTLLPGDPIDEAELSARYQVSRTPIREALLQLQAQGLVTSLPRAGMVVAKMDVAQLLAMWELLAELEGVCARLACERMSPSERAGLSDVHQSALSIVEQGDLEAWRKANSDFHEALYAGARNPYLRQEIRRMRARTGAYRNHAFGTVGNLRASWEEHGAIVDAIFQNAPATARDVVVRHLSPGNGMRGFAEFLSSLPQKLLD